MAIRAEAGAWYGAVERLAPTAGPRCCIFIAVRTVGWYALFLGFADFIAREGLADGLCANAGVSV